MKKQLENFRLEVRKFPEHKLFLYIDELGAYSFRELHGAAHGRFDISRRALNRNLEYYSEMQKIALNEVIRCHRVHPQPSPKIVQRDLFDDGPPKPIKWNYRKWYQFWKDWMNYFSHSEWEILKHKLTHEEDISQYLPRCNWDEVKAFDADYMPSVLSWDLSMLPNYGA